jgi:hypothetical protein
VLGFCRGADCPLGVEGGAWSKKREREQGSIGLCLGLLLLLRSKLKMTRGSISGKILHWAWTRYAGKPFGRFAKEEKEREKSLQGLWYAWTGSKLKFESL